MIDAVRTTNLDLDTFYPGPSGPGMMMGQGGGGGGYGMQGNYGMNPADVSAFFISLYAMQIKDFLRVKGNLYYDF